MDRTNPFLELTPGGKYKKSETSMMRIFDWISFRSQKILHHNSGGDVCEHIPGSYKWLPVIAHDYCTGCALCVEACDHGCLEMVWDFATLQRAQDCGSEGHCMAACPDDVIRMDWVSMDKENFIGRWKTEENLATTNPT